MWFYACRFIEVEQNWAWLFSNYESRHGGTKGGGPNLSLSKRLSNKMKWKIRFSNAAGFRCRVERGQKRKKTEREGAGVCIFNLKHRRITLRNRSALLLKLKFLPQFSLMYTAKNASSRSKLFRRSLFFRWRTQFHSNNIYWNRERIRNFFLQTR